MMFACCLSLPFSYIYADIYYIYIYMKAHESFGIELLAIIVLLHFSSSHKRFVIMPFFYCSIIAVVVRYFYVNQRKKEV